MPMPQTAFKAAGLREFGSRSETAVIRVEQLFQLLPRLAQRSVVQRCVRGGGHHAVEGERKLRILFAYLRAVAVVVLGHAPQQIGESGHAVARLLGKIRAAEKRAGVGVRNMVSGQPPPRCVISCCAT
jgi:hypothetical protein